MSRSNESSLFIKARARSASGSRVHEYQGVERIDRRHEKGLAIPIVRRATERLKCVVSPGVTLVIAPGVKAFALYTASELGGVHLIAGMMAAGKK